MLCRVYTCWMPARRSSHIWSRPICFSPWGFWVLFDDIVEPLVLSSTLPTFPAPVSVLPPGSSPQMISVLARCTLRARSPSGSCGGASESWSSAVRRDAVPLCTPGWRCLPLLSLNTLVTRWPEKEMKVKTKNIFTSDLWQQGGPKTGEPRIKKINQKNFTVLC